MAVGGALEPSGRIAVGTVESLLMSPCFRKGPRAAVVMGHAGRHHYLFTGASQMGRRSYSP
jgi:predicted TIM-barrel fold metal-dependent hydrolase